MSCTRRGLVASLAGFVAVALCGVCGCRSGKPPAEVMTANGPMQVRSGGSGTKMITLPRPETVAGGAADTFEHNR